MSNDLTRREFLRSSAVAAATAMAVQAVDRRRQFALGEPATTESTSWPQRAIQQAAYGVGPVWDRELGNVRAKIRVLDKADAVWVHVPWRRRDESPEKKATILVDAKTGERVRNVARMDMNREIGELVFQPATVPGEYFLYYLPYTWSYVNWVYSVSYLAPEATAEPAWLARHRLEAGGDQAWRALPHADVIEIEARNEFNRFDPMEMIATKEETEGLLARNSGRSYLTFPEERQFPIRMSDDLPARWIERGASSEFRGVGGRGEFYVFQIGVYAAKSAIPSLAVRFEDLKSKQGNVIGQGAMRCFNLGGTDCTGAVLKRNFSVERGKVGALWFGIEIPADAAAEDYRGTLVLEPQGEEPTAIDLKLEVSPQAVEDSGDNELWRQARLRWLDSTIGIDDQVTKAYTPLKIAGAMVECLAREVRFGAEGLPQSIRSNGREILGGAMSMRISTEQGERSWQDARTAELGSDAGSVTRQTTMSGGDLAMSCWTRMEFDGHIDCRVKISARKPTAVKDIRLEMPIRKEIATYTMGLGRQGGYRPKEWKWVWEIERATNQLWIGEVDAGLQCTLKGPTESGHISDWRMGGIPKSWGNDGKGGCTVTEQADQVIIRAYSGERVIEAGQEVEFHFALLITPVKPLSASHWGQRYFQQGYPEPGAVPVEKLLASGASIVNIHQGNELNPYINYPFLTVDKIASYVNEVHAAGLKAKLYYTVRELSNRVAELWALRSMRDEFFLDGAGGNGGAWLIEHLVSHYTSGWQQPLDDGEVDEAIQQTGASRWLNYYLEGLAYLLRKAQIDGLYLDGIGYDRKVMQRVRKVLDRNRPGSLIDFHCGDDFSFAGQRMSPANEYMEHFPYLDSLWFGEMFNYDLPPDYWLVEISGLPFGLFSDMLNGGGNPWRGMIYGMSVRSFGSYDPSQLWKLWESFGIKDAEMIGYWVASCPVTTGQQDVLATVYRKKSSVLITLASWAKEAVSVSLKIDWKALGLDAEKSKLTAPAISGLQDAATLDPQDKIAVSPGKGWLLFLSARNQ